MTPPQAEWQKTFPDDIYQKQRHVKVFIMSNIYLQEMQNDVGKVRGYLS